MIEYLEKLVEDREYQKALAYAEELMLKSDQTAMELLAINTAILVCRCRLDEFYGALVPGQFCVKLARDLEAWDYYGMACSFLGVAYSRLRQFESAITSLWDYIEKIPYYKDALRFEVRTWYNLGIIYTAVGDRWNSSQALSRALEAASRSGNEREAHGIRQALIQARIESNQLELIPVLLAKCLHYLRSQPEGLDIRESRLWHFKLRAEFALATNRLGRATAVATRVLNQCEDHSLFQFYFHMLLARIAQRSGNAIEALGHCLAARIHAVRCRRFDLESTAVEFIYDVTQAEPIDLHDVDAHYLFPAEQP